MASKPHQNPVPANIKAEMARRGITQDTLARRVGMKQQSLSRRLRFETCFTVAELLRIAEVLGVSAAELLKQGDA